VRHRRPCPASPRRRPPRRLRLSRRDLGRPSRPRRPRPGKSHRPLRPGLVLLRLRTGHIPRRPLDRGASVHQPEPERGGRVLLRRSGGRAPERAHEGPRTPRRCARLIFPVPWQQRGPCGDRRAAERGDAPRRERAEIGQPGADFGAARAGRGSDAALGRDLRPLARRHLRGPGRYRAVGRPGAQDHAAR
jgi:hypothetical protein